MLSYVKYCAELEGSVIDKSGVIALDTGHLVHLRRL
jgi:hypothetical protein